MKNSQYNTSENYFQIVKIPPYGETILKAIRFNLSHRTGQYAAEHTHLTTHNLLDNMIVELSTSILSEQKKEQKKIVFSYPKNWWQHFKMEVFPNWLQRIFPVQFKSEITVVDFSRSFLFPDAYAHGDKMLVRYVIKDSLKVNGKEDE